MSTAVAAAKRPFLITLVGVLGIIQGILSVLGGIALVAERNDQDLLSHVDVSSNALRNAGIYLIIIGALTILVSIGLLSGSSIARLVLAVLQVVQIAGGVYLMIAHEGTQRWDGLWYIIFGVFLLWVLYRARSEEFFRSRST